MSEGTPVENEGSDITGPSKEEYRIIDKISDKDIQEFYDRDFQLKNRRVKDFTESDFDLNSPNKVILKCNFNKLINECECYTTVILFFAEDFYSLALGAIFSLAASSAAGPVFATVNLKKNDKISKAFFNLTNNDVFGWAKYQTIPFILGFRGCNPVAFYNGSFDSSSILNWAFIKLSDSKYFEREQLSAGQIAENFVAMTSPDKNPDWKKSTDFKLGKSPLFTGKENETNSSSNLTPSKNPQEEEKGEEQSTV